MFDHRDRLMLSRIFDNYLLKNRDHHAYEQKIFDRWFPDGVEEAEIMDRRTEIVEELGMEEVVRVLEIFGEEVDPIIATVVKFMT